MIPIRSTFLAAFGFAMASLTPAVAATSAFVTTTLSERAGPSAYYPVVSIVPRSATVTIYGCLSDVSWCDVSYAGERGWIPGDYLECYYQERPVALAYYVTVVNITFVTFDVDIYWNTYYRDRPFFRERARFERFAAGPGRKDVKVAAAPVSAPGAKGGRFVAHPGHPQTLAFAAAGPRHDRLIKAGKGLHPTVVAGASVKAMHFAQVQGPPTQVVLARHAGRKPCPNGKPVCAF
jgi:uncharacterized protein YraI